MAELGKRWEAVVKQGLQKSFPDGFVYRLPDQITGNKFTSANPCDFFCFAQGKLFMIECKQHKGASIPFTAIPQYARLLQYKDLKDVFPGVIIWFSQKDKIIWCSIQQLEKMVMDGRKSISLKFLESGQYNLKQVSGQKKRVYTQPDFKCLLESVKQI